MRVAFLGNDEWSVPTLEAIAADPETDLAVVVTNPPRPAGRGSDLRPTHVARAARRLGAELVEAEGVADGPGWDALRGSGADVVVVVAYGRLLPMGVLALAPHGAINLHFSLLPRWRGAAPVERAILAGDRETGVTVMRIDEGLDTGPILARAAVPIGDREDAGTLGSRLAATGADLLVETLGRLAAGGVEAVPQDPDLATLAPRLTAEERWLDWTGTTASIVRRVRALAPRPGARTRFRSDALVVLRVEPERPDEDGSAPGAIDVSREGVRVRTGDGAVRLLEVAPAGRAHMPADAWARGARIARDERLG